MPNPDRNHDSQDVPVLDYADPSIKHQTNYWAAASIISGLLAISFMIAIPSGHGPDPLNAAISVMATSLSIIFGVHGYLIAIKEKDGSGQIWSIVGVILGLVLPATFAVV